MKHRLLVAFLTVLVFATGFAAHAWTETARPVPAPPKLGGEFAPNSSAPEGKKPVNRTQLIADIERNKTQIDAYRAQVMALDGEFEHGFTALLRPEQCEQYAAMQKKRADRIAEHEAKASVTLTDDDIDRLMQRPVFGVLNTLALSDLIEHLTKEYKLDAAQQGDTRELLLRRRDKFIALIGSTPPPSIRLSWLAPVVQKLADRAQK
ncbi:MAG TPA: hypothetical protein VG838_08870 [Opitutaceae bacterium]|nr:hypothetical protein [Opitutaceae bacterium]